jgi:hypothetical protein
MRTSLIQPLHPAALEAAIADARAWLLTANVEQLAAVAPADRARLVPLLRDIITEYPDQLFGAPVLIDWRSPEDKVTSLPRTTERAGTAELIGWLLPSANVFRPQIQSTLPVQTNAVLHAIAVFRTQSIGDIENEWWQHLFSAIPAEQSVYVAANIVLPLPDAIEAAQCMLPGARPPPLYFLSDDARAWAIAAGIMFHSELVERKAFRY